VVTQVLASKDAVLGGFMEKVMIQQDGFNFYNVV